MITDQANSATPNSAGKEKGQFRKQRTNKSDGEGGSEGITERKEGVNARVHLAVFGKKKKKNIKNLIISNVIYKKIII
jgi:hypothetical protein